MQPEDGRGVIALGVDDMAALVGVRSSEHITGMVYDSERQEVRIAIAGPWLPKVLRNGVPPIVDDGTR